MKKITYNNKQYVLNDPQYPVEKTVTDTDMNEIKEVVNFNADETLEENIKIKEQLERTKDALINITTEKSSNIHVEDSSNNVAKIGVFGISEQETREGYNLFNNTKTISNVTYNSEEDKWVFNLSNIYDHIALKDNFFENIKANTNYTIYLNILKNTANNIITFNPDKTIWNAGFNIQAGKTGVVVNNIKTKEDLSSALYDLWFSHTNTITGEFEAQIMLVEGIYTAENIVNYEQYGASPSPKYPSNIENVTGDINIKIYNKNLLDLTKCGFSNCVKNEDGSVRSNINNGYYAVITTSQLNDFILQNKGRSLTFSFEGISTKTIGFYIPCKRANSDSDYFETTKTGNSITMQIPEDLESLSYIQIRWNRQSTPFTDITTVINNIQLELNDVKTDFIEHEEQLITFPLAQGQKLIEGDYLADDGIYHKRKQIELDGTENWKLYIWQTAPHTKTTIFSLTNVLPQKNDAIKYCNYFNVVANTVTNLNKDEEYCLNSSAGTIYFSISNDIASTTQEFKDWLAERKTAGTPVIVEYELAEEEIEPYTPEQQEAYNKLQNVLSYKPVTNVFTDKALLEFKYIADTQTWVLNKINNTNQQILEIAGGN